MSAEERFIRIENLLGTLTEHHVRHAVEMEEIRQTNQKSHQSNQQFKEMVFTAGAKIFTLMRKNQVQIRELQEGQRQFQEGLRQIERKHLSLQELHRETEEKVHMLMDTVDRIIRNRNA